MIKVTFILISLLDYTTLECEQGILSNLQVTGGIGSNNLLGTITVDGEEDELSCLLFVP